VDCSFGLDRNVGAPKDIRRAAGEAQGLGLFVRSLVGMNRGAAKEVRAGFLAGKRLSANQIEFINLVVALDVRRTILSKALGIVHIYRRFV
jgi:type I restriction enzyme R subunit